LVVILCAISVHSEGVEPTTQPSEPAATTTKPYTPDNISEAAIELTHRQKIALSAVTDGQDWREPAFFAMLARTEELVDPETSSDEHASLEAPAVGNLTTYPNRYRAQKIRLTMRVFVSREYVCGSSEHWGPNRYWPAGKKVWFMAGWHTTEGDEKRKPLVVYSLVDPTELLGKPNETNASGEHRYNNPGRLLKLAGVYYKFFRSETLDSTPTVRRYENYPLVLAYYLKPTKDTTDHGSATTPNNNNNNNNNITNMVIIPAILVLLALYVGIRRARGAKRSRSSNRISGAGDIKYTPLRNIEDDDIPLDQQENEPVDPALIDAVKAFESKRNTNDATDDKS
ncbi:MAG: hypothetical protein GY794_12225, partial [bacterium]|nr:hypothetical protein [bacterium]